MNFYKCNPDKAIRCSKTTCYLNGGKCRLTTNIDYAKDSTPLWLEEINGKVVYLGLDLSETNDNTSVKMVGVKEIKKNGKTKKEKP